MVNSMTCIFNTTKYDHREQSENYLQIFMFIYIYIYIVITSSATATSSMSGLLWNLFSFSWATSFLQGGTQFKQDFSTHRICVMTFLI